MPKRRRYPKPILVELPPTPPPAEGRKRRESFRWLFFLIDMHQAQVDALHFGVNAFDDEEWEAFAVWYRELCRKPAREHMWGTVFPLSATELRHRLRNH